jgi:hypothetical protein
MVHLTVIYKLTVVTASLPGATNEESALYALEQFASGRLRPGDR